MRDDTWTRFEQQIAISGFRAGLTAEQIARQIPSRTALAVGKRLLDLGYRMSDRSTPIWSPSEDERALIRACWAGDMTITDLHERLGVSRDSIYAIAASMGLGVRVASFGRPTAPPRPKQDGNDLTWLAARYAGRRYQDREPAPIRRKVEAMQ